MTQTAVCEAVLAHVKAVTFAPQQIIGGYLQVLDLDFGMPAMDRVGMRALDRHVLDVALDPVTGIRQLHNEGRELLVARRVRIGLGHHQGNISDAGGR